MGEAYNLVVSICLNVLKGVKKKLYENVDAQKEPSRHLRAPVQGRCDGRQEGSLYAQASGIGERSQPPRHQSLPISQVQGNGHGTVRLETLLLVPDQRGYPVLARLPPPSPRDRAGDVETRRRRAGSIQTRWRQDRRRWCWRVSRLRVPRRIRARQASGH